MDLSRMLSLVEKVPAYRRLKEELSGSSGKAIKLAAVDAVKPFLIAALHQGLNLPILVVAAQPENAKRLYDELQAWCPDSKFLSFFPETDFLLGEYSESDAITSAERLRTLSALTFRRDMPTDERRPLIISSALAAVGRTAPRDKFQASCHSLKVGMNIDPLQLAARWQDIGYEFENVVEIPGTVSRRGGIIDVFPPDRELPARIEFVGNQIESIRYFDPKTQRSLELVKSVNIAPATENKQNISGDTIVDYLTEKTILITDDLDELKTVVK